MKKHKFIIFLKKLLENIYFWGLTFKPCPLRDFQNTTSILCAQNAETLLQVISLNWDLRILSSHDHDGCDTHQQVQVYGIHKLLSTCPLFLL